MKAIRAVLNDHISRQGCGNMPNVRYARLSLYIVAGSLEDAVPVRRPRLAAGPFAATTARAAPE
eukprot:12663025-Heterocapsa_arctica.AAC.1